MSTPTDSQGAPLSVALVHWPVFDKRGDIVCTNVTNLDIHDIARASRTYGVETYFIVNTQKPQQIFVHRILDHWRVGEGSQYNQMRKTALTMIETVGTLEDAIATFKVKPLVIGTSARPQSAEKSIGFVALREKLALTRQPVLLVFGTGWGLAPAVEPLIDLWLEPIKGASKEDYRHLSVRSAASICLDRLLGAW